MAVTVLKWVVLRVNNSDSFEFSTEDLKSLNRARANCPQIKGNLARYFIALMTTFSD